MADSAAPAEGYCCNAELIAPRMPRTTRPTVDEKLDELNATSSTTDRAVVNAAVQQALEHKHYRVVARAAVLAGERGLHERMADMLAAYGRFVHDPVKKDPQCFAK